ncbi:MAG: AraC family transcriptional regulator [Oscillospiraceae bacterium]|jgi:AraC-like DNA-binding protein|nr:AraC family transcriptional regulator [Oscillospiraceae bacterium]
MIGTRERADRAERQDRLRRSAQYQSEVERYVRDHLTGRIRVADIAELLRMNASHLNASFKAATGESITSYIQRQKIELAKRLLATRRSLADIWTELAYCDQSHFTRQFKRLTGLTPLQYRRALGGQHTESSAV